MNWQDEAFLLGKRKFRENANIIDIFSNLYGKVSGIVYGGNSRKIRNLLQISNNIFVIYTAKNENRIGYFKTELIEPISPRFFNDKKRTSALLSLSALLNNLLPESQPYKSIYSSLKDLTKNLSTDNWPILYVYWELKLIKELGYDPNFKENLYDLSKDKKISNLEIDGVKYNVPNFIIKNEIPDLNRNLIKNALIFNRNLMLNKFFIPNNMIFPKARIILESYFS